MKAMTISKRPPRTTGLLAVAASAALAVGLLGATPAARADRDNWQSCGKGHDCTLGNKQADNDRRWNDHNGNNRHHDNDHNGSRYYFSYAPPYYSAPPPYYYGPPGPGYYSPPTYYAAPPSINFGFHF